MTDIKSTVIASVTCISLGSCLVFLRGMLNVAQVGIYTLPLARIGMKSENKSLLLCSLAGIVMGYMSFLVVDALFALALAVAVGFVLKFASEKLAKEKKGLKWWLSNGGFSFFLIWFVVWVMLLNIIG